MAATAAAAPTTAGLPGGAEAGRPGAVLGLGGAGAGLGPGGAGAGRPYPGPSSGDATGTRWR